MTPENRTVIPDDERSPGRGRKLGLIYQPQRPFPTMNTVNSPAPIPARAVSGAMPWEACKI